LRPCILVREARALTDKMNVDIRVATLDDCDALAAVHVTAWEETYRALLPSVAFAAMTVPIRTERWRQRLVTTPELPVYVAELDGKVVALGDGGPARENETLGQEMQVYALYVVNRAKRRGIATQIVRRLVGDFRAQGASSACVWTLREATVARLFYESTGAEFAVERLEQRPGYERTLVGYVWRDLRRACSDLKNVR
jgi:L-amino acid N-acyltransferase YncA